jgi:predicted transcriptional regulator
MLNAQGRRIDRFAQQAGVSRWAFWRYETGCASPPSDWYERAAAILGVAVEDIAPLESAA